jgi:branched-chain amino acid aminotransferase
MRGNQMWMYRDGEFLMVPEDDFERWRPGAFPGRGAFESMVLTDGRIESWCEHWDRLNRALRLMKIPLLKTERDITAAMRQVFKRNGERDARIRLCVFRDQGRVHVTVMAPPLRRPSRRDYETGWTLGWSSSVRDPGRLSHVKTLDYQRFHAAREEALSQGWNEGLLCNRRGEVVEAAYSNVFGVQGGVLWTPPVGSGCLSGITRRIVLRLATALGIPRQIKPMVPQDLRSVDEIFLTNAVIGVMPCVRLESYLVGDGRPGPVTLRLSAALASMRRACH